MTCNAVWVLSLNLWYASLTDRVLCDRDLPFGEAGPNATDRASLDMGVGIGMDSTDL